MSKKNIQESQQQGQGVTIGNQGNEDMVTPDGAQKINNDREQKNDREIPNQDRSSASNQKKGKQ
jgi:hypothetical protein